MGWLKDAFTTKDPETGKETKANVKLDEKGYVSDFVYGVEKDKDGGKHGHVWGLNSDDDEDIGGRDSKPAKDEDTGGRDSKADKK